MHGVPSASQRKASATAADCRYTRKGRFSAWLIKGKSDGVKAKWFQSLGRRYFTLDFDRQIFYYAHSESRKSQVSKPIHFRDILGAHAGHSYEPDDLCCPGQAKVTRSLSGVLSRPRPPAPGIFPFTVRTRGKRLRLEAEVEAEVFQWIAMLNAAHRIGEDVDLLSSSTWLPDAPTASPSSRSPRSEAGKAPSVTSVEASQMSTTADADENYSELGMPSPHSKAWSETGCEELDVGEDLAGEPFFESRGIAGSEDVKAEAEPSCLKASDFGFEEDEWPEEADLQESSPSSPSTPRGEAEPRPEGVHGDEDHEAPPTCQVSERRVVEAEPKAVVTSPFVGGYQPSQTEEAARIAADLRLLQLEAARRSFRGRARPNPVLE